VADVAANLTQQQQQQQQQLIGDVSSLLHV
jgi:hypothetical protein